MKIFITGGTGFMGGFLIKELIQNGHQVKAMIRKTSSLKYLQGLQMELVYGDVTNQKSLQEATKEIDVVIHLASLISKVSVLDSLYHEINVKGTKNVFQAAYENNKKGLKQFIYCSSEAVYGDIKDEQELISEKTPCIKQTTIYGKTKYLGELAARKLANKFKIPLTIVRPSRIYGERDESFLSMCR